MTLTLSHGPLSLHPARQVNYKIAGPEHRLLVEPFPRRVRATLGGETVFDTTRGQLLFESGALPELLVPEDEFGSDCLKARHERNEDPFKGQSVVLDVRVDGQVAERAGQLFDAPSSSAPWLRGLVLVEWDSMDRWFDEEEEVKGHLRDPYHRVDARRSGRHVRVLANGHALADSKRPVVVSETGLSNRYYLPPDDVLTDLLVPSSTSAICPYKGVASYWSLEMSGQRVEDVAWSYPKPLESVEKAPGYLCFLHDAVRTEVDGTSTG